MRTVVYIWWNYAYCSACSKQAGIAPRIPVATKRLATLGSHLIRAEQEHVDRELE